MQENPRETSHAASTDAESLSQKLRIATAELHDRAERHSFQASIVEGRASKASYCLWLRQLRELHSTLESAFSEHAGRTREFSSVISTDQFKVRLIDDDLRNLGVGEALAPAVPAAEAMAARIRSGVAESPLSLLGYWYVLEGATNGNKFLAKTLSRVFGADAGLSYLDPYGEYQRQNWVRWKSRIDELRLSDEVRARIVDAAKNMFLGLAEIMDSLLACDPGAPGMSIDGLVAGHTLPLAAMRRGARNTDAPKGR